MTFQTPPEKKCDCPEFYPYHHILPDHHLNCPLYTPPAQEGRCLHDFEDDCSGCKDGLCCDAKEHLEKCVKPPQLKKPECICSFNDPEHRENCPVIKEPEMWQSQFLNQGTKMTGMDLSCMVGLVSSFIYDARLSAAAEERKRVCEEMKRKISMSKLPGLNKAIVYSLIESIKNSV